MEKEKQKNAFTFLSSFKLNRLISLGKAECLTFLIFLDCHLDVTC